MNRVLLLIAALLFASILSCRTKLSSKTESIVNELDKYPVMVTDSTQGVIGSNIYNNFSELEESASSSELVKLLDHKNPVVQGYSIWALVDSKYAGIPPIFTKLLTSQDTVTTVYADTVDENPLALVLYHRVLNKTRESNIPPSELEYYSDILSKLDSLILYSDFLANRDDFYSTYYIFSALVGNNQKKTNYERIRKLALEHDKLYALIELDKYQDPRDSVAIKEQVKQIFDQGLDKQIYGINWPEGFRYLLAKYRIEEG